MMHSDGLIIGAGPTGLVLALWLTKLGVKVRIIDKTAEPGTTSRALAVHARALELYRQLDLADPVISRGHKVPAVNLCVKGESERANPGGVAKERDHVIAPGGSILKCEDLALAFGAEVEQLVARAAQEAGQIKVSGLERPLPNYRLFS